MQSVTIQNINTQELEMMFSKVVTAALEKFKTEFSIKNPEVKVDKLLTKSETAKYLQISTPTLLKYINQGYIKAHTVAGTRMRFKPSDLDKALVELRRR